MAENIVTLNPGDSYGSVAQRAAKLLREGGVVVFPTETVYGIAASAASAPAIARLRAIKGRADAQPFTVHLGQPGEAENFFVSSPPLARRLSRKFWPGPLTLICDSPNPQDSPAGRSCPPGQLGEIFSGDTIGFRVVDHPLTAEILTASGIPVVASSANRAGAAPPAEVDGAVREMMNEVDLVIDAGRARLAVASTIVRVQGNDWSIVRRGAIDERALRRKVVSEVLFVCTGNSCRSPMAEYFFRKRLSERLGTDGPGLAARGCLVSSAGTFASPGGPISTGARAELARRGIDASSHLSQPVTPELAARCERIYCMTPEHRDLVLEVAPSAGDRVSLLDEAGVSDPMGGSAEDYSRCADQIDQAVARRVEEFVDEDRHW